MKTKIAGGEANRGARAFLPKTSTLPVLREAVQHCTGCDIYRYAIQAVFGESVEPKPQKIEMMLIGEQPGDREDKEGHPFAGPAGHLLDRCLEESGIVRDNVYVTNAVKHFKWEPRGKLRIHKKPSSSEIFACRPWMEAEIKAVKPALIVCWVPWQRNRYSDAVSELRNLAWRFKKWKDSQRSSRPLTHLQYFEQEMRLPGGNKGKNL